MNTSSKIPFIVATGNPGKLRELEGAFASERFDYKTLQDIHFNGTIEENAPTFAGNAVIKVQALERDMKEKKLSGFILADDSGLEVFALGNAPGVFSARYAGFHGDDTLNTKLLLQNMAAKNLQSDNARAARFVCTLALTYVSSETENRNWNIQKIQERFPGTKVIENCLIVDGECRGKISFTERGQNGFGYDPVFIPEGESRTFAEMETDEKKSMSHRGRALIKMAEILQFCF